MCMLNNICLCCPTFRVPFDDMVAVLAQWLRSLPPNPEVPSSIPGLIEG